MRRSDKEVKTKEELEEIIKNCKVCRIGLIENGYPYIVPMNFGYKYEDNLVLYFHSAKEGRKINALKNNNNVCFEMDCDHGLDEGELPCDYSYFFGSIMGEGTAEFMECDNEKFEALNAIMFHQTGKKFEFNSDMTKNVAVFKITAKELCGKRQK